MRLIDADALGIGYPNRSVFENSAYADGWNAAIVILKNNAPTIEVERPTKAQFKRMAIQLGYEQVVHCKDCKYGFFSIGGNLYCTHSEGLSSQTPGAFCNYGEYKRNTEGIK